MTDYVQTTDFSVKDALPANDPEKDILGADIDVELGDISTAIATKYDSSDIASQAQAEAGASNEVLMTPLRVAQYLTGGIGSGTSGALTDIGALADPGDDRILYWDESADTVTWLDIGTHLEITAGSVVNVVESGIDHDALTNFVADEHIAHSSVIPTASDGVEISLTGTGIEAAFDYSLAINSLTAETTLDGTNDYFAMYDASAAVHKKVNIDSLLGEAVGDGKWYRNTTTAITTTPTTIIYNTEVNDNLQNGTFSTVTGQYTAATGGARIIVTASCDFPGVNSNQAPILEIQVNGTVKAKISSRRNAAGDNLEQISTQLVLAASDVVRVQAYVTGGTDTSAGGEAICALSITEIA